MKKIVVLVLALMVSTGSLFAQKKYSTFYHQRVSLFEQLKIDSEDIVFIGNSIVNGGEWFELFDNPHVKNRGISGDISQGVYDRLDPILEGRPQKIFLMIGINDLGRGASVDSVVVRIERIIDKIQQESPKSKLYLQSVLPVNDEFGRFSGHTRRWAEIKPLNLDLARLAASKQIAYIDLYSEFIAPGSEKLDPAYTNDGLHLLGKGYVKWASIIKEYLAREEE